MLPYLFCHFLYSTLIYSVYRPLPHHTLHPFIPFYHPCISSILRLSYSFSPLYSPLITPLPLHFTSPSCVSLCSSFISSCPLYCTSRLVILLLLPLNSTALPFHIIVVYFILSIPSLFAPLFRPTSPIPSVSPSWLSIPLLFYSTIFFYSLFILPCCLTSPLSLSHFIFQSCSFSCHLLHLILLTSLILSLIISSLYFS